jgi:transcriptional regulator with XRE-family HTH domain
MPTTTMTTWSATPMSVADEPIRKPIDDVPNDVIDDYLQHHTKAEIARKVGVTKGYITKLFKGQRLNPSPAILEELAGLFDTPIEQVLTALRRRQARAIQAGQDARRRLREQYERDRHSRN